MACTVVIDEGTTSTRAILFDEDGEMVAMARRNLKTSYPQKGWVEQSALEVYEKSVQALEEVLSKSKCEVKYLALTNQRETVVAWDENGEPLYNALVWMDKRGAHICEEMKEKGFEELIRAKTGLLLDPYFSASKMKWLLENVENVRRSAKKGRLKFGTIDSYLLWKLTGKHVTEPSNASRTLLFNIETSQWDEELLKIFDVPLESLPCVVESVFDFGVSRYGRVCAVLGDQQAALFGNACYKTGEAKCTYGTGAFVLANVGDGKCKKEGGLLKTIAWKINGKTVYALEGSILNSGQNVNWLKNNKFINDEKDFETLANSVSSSRGVYFVPALDGLGAPRWQPNARAMFVGLSSFHTKAHFVRAVLDAMAFSVAEVVEAFEKSGVKISNVSVDGGASQNDLLIQTLCDTIGVPIKRSKTKEMTAYGAFLASKMASGCGFDDLKKYVEDADVFDPQKTCSQGYEKWKIAEDVAIKWSKMVSNE